MIEAPDYSYLWRWRWRTSAERLGAQVDYGDACILFNPLSATTHLVQPAVMAVLEALSRQPATINELILALGLTAVEADQAKPGLARILWELDLLGLVTPVGP